MLTNIDASKQKTAETTFSLYKVVSLDSYTGELKDPFHRGPSFVVGETSYRSVQIVSDGYETFVSSASCAFAEESVCRHLVKILNKQYNCMSGCFGVVRIEIEKGSIFYTGYDNSENKSIKVYAIENFTVMELLPDEES